MTDDELVVLARQGDADAFGQLVRRHQAAVYRAALAAVHVPEDAEEVAQDAFVRGWASLRTFRHEASFRSWILTIAWNRAISRRRSVVGWFRKRAPLEELTQLSAQTNADEYARAGEVKAHAVRAIAALTPKLRDALVLAHSGEYDYGEIASMLKIPIGTVKWRVAEARRQVRLRLAAVGYVDAT